MPVKDELIDYVVRRTTAYSPEIERFVVADFLDPLPITEEELRIFETYMGDVIKDIIEVNNAKKSE